MKRFRRFLAAVTASLMCMAGLSLGTISAEEAEKTVIFSGSATKEFTTCDILRTEAWLRLQNGSGLSLLPSI